MLDLHAERPEVLQAADDLVGNLRVAFDFSGVDLRFAELAQLVEEGLPSLDGLGRPAGVGMDQVQPQPAEKQLLAETGLAPLRLPRLLGGFPGLPLADI